MYDEATDVALRNQLKTPQREGGGLLSAQAAKAEPPKHTAILETHIADHCARLGNAIESAERAVAAVHNLADRIVGERPPENDAQSSNARQQESGPPVLSGGLGAVQSRLFEEDGLLRRLRHVVDFELPEAIRRLSNVA